MEAFSLYVWFGLIDTYCETTRETFENAWQTEINYFLIEYAMEKNRRLIEKQKQMRLQL